MAHLCRENILYYKSKIYRNVFIFIFFPSPYIILVNLYHVVLVV